MADKNKPLTQEFYTRPIEVGAWQGFKTFLWNGETSQFLGRTGSSWGEFSFFFNFLKIDKFDQLFGQKVEKSPFPAFI